MSIIYKFIPNYAIAIIVFTIVTRLLLLPISYKTQKDAARMRLLRPKLEKIQKSFAGNQNRIAQEQQKLYQEEGINQFSSCLPSLLQFLLFFGIIDVIYKPIKHILHFSRDVREAAVTKASEIAVKMGDINGGKSINLNDLKCELLTMEAVSKHRDQFLDFADNFADTVTSFAEKFTLFGANLGQTPTLHPEVWNRETIILALIPIFAGLTQLITSVYTMLYQQKNNPMPQQGGGCMWGMMLMMPVLSVWWGYGFPAGVGFYWIWSAVISFIVTLGLNTYFTNDRVVAINEKEKQKAKEYAEKHPDKKSWAQMLMEASQEIENTNAAAAANADGEEGGKKRSKAEINKKNSQAIKDSRSSMAEKYDDDDDILSNLSESEKNAVIEARRRMAEKYGDDNND